MANTSTLIETIPSNFFNGKIRTYHVAIDTISTYVNIAPAPASTKYQNVLGILAGFGSATTITWGLSATADVPIAGITNLHQRIERGAYVVGTLGYRIQVKTSVVGNLYIALIDLGAVAL